jgi:hypothetical protein
MRPSPRSPIAARWRSKNGVGSLTRRCSGIKRDGGRCAAIVTGPNDYCYQHDPANAARRRQAASRAGRTKPNKEVATLKAELGQLKDDVLAGNVDRNDAAVVVQIYRVLKDLVELERKVKTTEELTEQIRELKRRVDGQRRSWR